MSQQPTTEITGLPNVYEFTEGFELVDSPFFRHVPFDVIARCSTPVLRDWHVYQLDVSWIESTQKQSGKTLCQPNQLRRVKTTINVVVCLHLTLLTQNPRWLTVTCENTFGK